MKFGELNVGDMFNTKAARYVKTGEQEAIVVQSAVFSVGAFNFFAKTCDTDLVVLYSSKQDVNE